MPKIEKMLKIENDSKPIDNRIMCYQVLFKKKKTKIKQVSYYSMLNEISLYGYRMPLVSK